MVRRLGIVLEDILTAIDGIESAVRERGLDNLDQDWLLMRGIERGLEIVSEAVRHIPESLLATENQISWPAIKAIGNRLRHEYHHVSPRIVKSVVIDDLPSLRAAIEAMLKRVDD